jgi:peptidase A4-like protein
MVKRLKVSRMLMAAALALATGGAAAVAVVGQAAGNAPSHSAAATTQHQSKHEAAARASLLKYLGKNPLGSTNSPFKSINPVKMAPSTSRKQATSQPGVAEVGNYEWSGYQDSATPGTFTGVSGTWRVPAASCTKEQRVNAMLVGFDGVGTKGSSVDVGTISYCYQGSPQYFTWWDILPNATTQVSDSIHAGDLVTVSATRSGTSYTMSLTDANDHSQDFSATQSCTYCQAQSVEWIAERPYLPYGVAPLEPFHWTVTNASQTSNGVTGGIAAGPSPTRITMLDVLLVYPLDSVSNLSRNGTSFSAHWLNSY